MILLILFDFSRKSGLKFGVWIWGTPKGKGVGERGVSGKFLGNLNRDGGPSVQKMIL